MLHNDTMNSPEVPFARRRWMLGAGFAAALAGASLAWWRLQPRPPAPQANHDFWHQGFVRPDGAEFAMGGFLGRPLLVNFWATWCPPCVEELPMLEAFWRENGPKGLQIVGLAIDQPSSVRRFLERQPLSFPIGLAGLEGTQLAKSLGNTAGGLPFTVFFDQDGGIYRQKLGQLTQMDLDLWRARHR